MKVEWSFDAATDLNDIVEYVALNNPHAADRLDRHLSSAAARLVDFPQSGQKGRIPGTRELLAEKHYRVIYTVTGDTIRIEAVIHTSRQWPPVDSLI